MKAILPPAMPRAWVSARTMSSAKACAAVRGGPGYGFVEQGVAAAIHERALEAAAAGGAARGVGGRTRADGQRERAGHVEVVGEDFGGRRAVGAGERIEREADLPGGLGDGDDRRILGARGQAAGDPTRMTAARRRRGKWERRM